MSEYTVTLRTLIANNFTFGLTDYLIFDETYRATLNAKILRHYNYREIGFETPSLFKEYLNRTMSEIMPLYNQFYKSALLLFNPFYTYVLTTNSTHQIDGATTGTGHNVSNAIHTGTVGDTKTETVNALNVESDTPQGQISIANLKSNAYASKAGMQDNTNTVVQDGSTGSTVDDTTDATSGGTINNLDTYISHAVGTTSARSNASLLMEFRQSFINIDMMIIDELNNLFMGVF